MRNVRGLRAAVLVGCCLTLASLSMACGGDGGTEGDPTDGTPSDGQDRDGEPGDGQGGDGQDGSQSTDGSPAEDGSQDGSAADGEDGLDGGTDAGEDEDAGNGNGGVIEGPALLHAAFANPMNSNVQTDEINYDMPSGMSSDPGSGRFTMLTASIPSGTGSTAVSIAIAGELRVGRTFDLVAEAYSATDGRGYVSITQTTYSPISTNAFMSASGTVTIEALQGSAIKVSGSGIPMQSANGIPGNGATGTFDLNIEMQVLTVSGL